MIVAVNCLYWLCFWLFFPKKKPSYPDIRDKRLSIIVVFKNEKQNLKQLIPSLLSQQYDHCEIILMDDHSSDDYQTLIPKYQDGRLRWLSAQKDAPGKKSALAEAINHAQHEIVLLTDADCRPNSPTWVSKMMSQFDTDTEIVLGYGPNNRAPGLVNLFARFETFLTALQYMSYAGAGMPYMGVGRNLAYRRMLYVEKKPDFKGQTLSSGDDDLSILSMANATNTKSVTHPDTWCYSDTKDSWQAFLAQKTRHTSTSYQYGWLHQGLLAVFAISQIMFYGVGLLFVLPCCPFVFGFAWLTKLAFVYLNFRVLDGAQFRFSFPLLDFLLSIYYLVLAPMSIFAKKTEW